MTEQAPKKHAPRTRMADVMALVSDMQKQNAALVAAIREQAKNTQAPTVVEKAVAVPAEVTSRNNHRSLSAISRRTGAMQKHIKYLGAKVDEKLYDRFTAMCYSKRIPMYEGFEVAISTWLELEGG